MVTLLDFLLQTWLWSFKGPRHWGDPFLHSEQLWDTCTCHCLRSPSIVEVTSLHWHLPRFDEQDTVLLAASLLWVSQCSAKCGDTSIGANIIASENQIGWCRDDAGLVRCAGGKTRYWILTLEQWKALALSSHSDKLVQSSISRQRWELMLHYTLYYWNRKDRVLEVGIAFWYVTIVKNECTTKCTTGKYR